MHNNLQTKKATKTMNCATKQHIKRIKIQMDIANSFKQIKAYARIEGAILGVIWVASLHS